MISHADILIRLAAAAAIGSLVGFERERLLWSAGIRTHMLVSVGACLIMIVSAYGFQNATQMPHVVLDPSRAAAQVVSGVGFLGAGSILLKGNVVRGMTTAASIWAVAALGLAAGGGLYFAAGAATIIILVILAGLKPIEEAYRAAYRAAPCACISSAEACARMTSSACCACAGARSAGSRRALRKTGWSFRPSTSCASRARTSSRAPTG
ncbi:MgtC/SapB family protein [Novosphingobium sp. 9]|uniref:MgtC/SapB family protein n=1 Tax=Novosphingobium sp. 9 TaxID=2025349 RepID=UPI0021B4FDC0|nr:MgtC/SapB family protein [Novosphingobium sp. 9]